MNGYNDQIEECVTNIELRANPTTIVDFEPKVSETPIKPVVVINNVNNLIKTKKINDITSLVKPKRKVMEDEQSEKKLRHFDGKSQQI